MASERATLTAAMAYDAGREDGRREAAAEIARLSRELEEARERERRLREAVLDTIRKACRCEEYYRAIEREDPQCQAHDIEYYVEQVFEASG
jgi:hypothetical protein